MKRMLSGILTAAMLLSLVGCGGSSESETTEDPAKTAAEAAIQEQYQEWEAQVVYNQAADGFSGGDGSAEAPYEIRTAGELQFLSEAMSDNDVAWEYRRKNYILMEDISLNDTSDYENWVDNRPEYDWMPIDDFSGVFDGNNHVISGMYINTVNVDASAVYGLFDTLYGTVQDLTLENAYVEVTTYNLSPHAGLLVGSLLGDVINCRTEGTVVGYQGDFGGIVGSSYGLVSGCSFDGTVKALESEGNEYRSLSLGGIAGLEDATDNLDDWEWTEPVEGEYGINNCVNYGTIDGICYADSIGGIAGNAGGALKDCRNEGTVKGDAGSSYDYPYIGGIAGIFIVSTKGADGKITGCENDGTVISDGGTAGGIAGLITLSDPRYDITVEDCVNKGEMQVTNHFLGGIVGDVTSKVERTITISGCTNEADLEGMEAAGIVYRAIISGTILLTDNCNNGSVTATGEESLYAAGILGYAVILGGDWKLDVENCINNGDVTSGGSAGGIVCFTYSVSDYDNASFIINNSKNTGDIYSNTINGCMGGILAVDGFMNVETEISNCVNEGDLTFNKTYTITEIDDYLDTYALALEAGGIVGRVGQSLLISVDADEKLASELNKEDALVTIQNCKNTGEIQYMDPVKGDDISENDYQLVLEYKRFVYVGGILGNCSCTDGYSVRFENCTWDTTRGVGNPYLPDIE